MKTYKNRYLPTAISVYTNYFLHGMQAIAISQHSEIFMQRWNTDSSGIIAVIAWTGLGKFLTVWICGEISDRWGRKPLIFAGIVGYILFFTGLLFSGNIFTASITAFIGGAATSCFDGASYPALQESFPQSPGSAVVAVKGFIAAAQMLYPLVIGMLLQQSIWFGWAIAVPLAITVINFFVLCTCPFSYDEQLKAGRKSGTAVKKKQAAEDLSRFKSKPKFAVEGVCCMAYGFVSLVTFYLISQVLTMYAKDYIGMSDMSSRLLLTLYTIGSLLAVFISAAVMAKGVKTIAVLLVYTCGSMVSLLMLSLFPVPAVACAASFTIGFFAAGGALQAGIAVMGEFFGGSKGRNLGIYYTSMGLGSYAGPMIASWLMKYDLRYVMYFDTVIAIIGFILVVIMAFRYRRVFGKKIFSIH